MESGGGGVDTDICVLAIVYKGKNDSVNLMLHPECIAGKCLHSTEIMGKKRTGEPVVYLKCEPLVHRIWKWNSVVIMVYSKCSAGGQCFSGRNRGREADF